MRSVGVLALLLVGGAGCASTQGGQPVPARSHVIPLPKADGDRHRVDAVGVAHALRGMHALQMGNPADATEHLRLALLYAPDSALLHERLARAWRLRGDWKRAERALADGLSKTPADPDLNLAAGWWALGDGKPHVALAHLELSAAHPDTRAEAGPALVDALMWEKKKERALNLAAQLVAEPREEPNVILEVAAYLEDHGALTEALDAYRRARKLRPASRYAAVGEMRVLTLLGRSVDAAQSLVPLFAYYPDEPQLFVQMSRLLRRSNHSDAEAYRREALRQTEGDPNGRTLVAVGDLVEGHTESGLRLLKEVVNQYPDVWRARLFLAEEYARAGQGAACLEMVEGGDHAEALVSRLRGWCLGASGDLAGLVTNYVPLMRDEDVAHDVLMDAMRLLVRGKDEERAAKRLEKLVAAGGERLTERDRILARAQLLDAFGHIDRALETMQTALAKEPEDSDLRLRVADLQVRAGRIEPALDTLEALRREDPFNALRLNALGFTLADEETRLDEASVWLRRAYRLAPEEGFIADSLGWLFYRQGDLEAAKRLIEQARLSAPNDPEILRHLGDVYRALGNEKRAQEIYVQALAAFPSVPLRALLERRIASS